MKNQKRTAKSTGNSSTGTKDLSDLLTLPKGTKKATTRKPATKKAMTEEFAKAVLASSTKRAKKAKVDPDPAADTIYDYTDAADRQSDNRIEQYDTQKVSEEAQIVVDVVDTPIVGSTIDADAINPDGPHAHTEEQEQKMSILTLGTADKKNREVTYLLGKTIVARFKVSQFKDGAPATIDVAGVDFVEKVEKAPKAPKTPKVKLTAEEKAAAAAERKAARAAKPKPTLAELAARARARADKLAAEAAAAENGTPAPSM